jgi:hypothetical protein
VIPQQLDPDQWRANPATGAVLLQLYSSAKPQDSVSGKLSFVKYPKERIVSQVKLGKLGKENEGHVQIASSKASLN